MTPTILPRYCPEDVCPVCKRRGTVLQLEELGWICGACQCAELPMNLFLPDDGGYHAYRSSLCDDSPPASGMSARDSWTRGDCENSSQSWPLKGEKA